MSEDKESSTQQDVDALMKELQREQERAPQAGGAEAVLPLSPMLQMLPAKRRPDPMPMCGSCPKSMWLTSDKGGLRCFCRVMHAMVWTVEESPILACDGALVDEE